MNFSIQNLLDIMNFSLHNCLGLKDKKIIWQNNGIPMGDPLSPPIAIITCAWFEKLWAERQTNFTNNHFKTLRYLDDIIAISSFHDHHTISKNCVITEFKNNCYPEPLTLKATDPKYYLECEIINNQEVRHFNKNASHIDTHNTQLFYKLPHYHSYTPTLIKMGTMMGEFSRILTNCETPQGFLFAGEQKINEFKLLQYPTNFIKRTLTKLAYKRNNNLFTQLLQSNTPTTGN